MARTKKNRLVFLGLGILILSIAVLFLGLGFAEDNYFLLNYMNHLGDSFDLAFGNGLEILVTLCIFITAILSAIVGILYLLKILKKDTLGKISLFVLFVFLLATSIIPYCTFFVSGSGDRITLANTLGMWAYWLATGTTLVGSAYACIYKKLF